MNSCLKVYRASAGSGKTFRLAVEYIRLLVENPEAYRHVLAVTFTNKATTEMKDRILSQLYGIWKGLPASNDYVQAILSMDGMGARTETWVRERAGVSLRLLLADYVHFRVETIDAYFQSILREVARDLRLPNDFRIELDVDWPVEEGVRDLFSQLATNKRLMGTMMRIVDERIANTEGWNVGESLRKFGKHLYNEQYLAFPWKDRQTIGDMDMVAAYKGVLRQWEWNVGQSLQSIAERFEEACLLYGVTEAMVSSRGVNTLAWIAKLKGGKPHVDTNGRLNIAQTIRDRAFDAEKWLTKKTKGSDRVFLLSIIIQYLLPLLQEVIATEERAWEEWCTIKAIRKHIDTLTFVNAINDNVRNLNEQSHRFLLADTAHFLNELIDESDVPFLYERSGVRFHHVMIDEFQDTSRLQWQNFRPLVKNSLDGGYDCLIVGDVKQSIYRWRNSDWGILNGLEGDADFADCISPIVEDRNFRSSKTVVAFNNDFFAKANEELATFFEQDVGAQSGASDEIRAAYGQLRQEALAKQEGRGYVRICVGGHAAEEGTEGSADDYGKHLEQVGDTVRDLLQAGVRMGDIAILTRKNQQISDVIRHLMGRTDMPVPIELVSPQAFQLDASPAVQTLVQALRVLDNPDDRTQLVLLALLHSGDETTSASILLTPHEDVDALWERLPEAFAARRSELPLMSLYELAEWIIRQFNLHEREGQAPYLFAFLDKLSQYLQGNEGNLHAFLDQWDNDLHKATVSVDGTNGIRLLTIHKAKGLEFNTVIVPFCDWSMQGQRDSLLWADTQRLGPYDKRLTEIPLVPLPFEKNTTGQSLFKQEYADETKRFFVDNLNLMYVAFTRAVDNLIILCSKPESPKDNNSNPTPSACSLLTHFVERSPEGMSSPEDGIYEWGTLTLPTSKGKREENNPLLFPATPQEVLFTVGEPMLQFRQSKQSARYLRTDDEGEMPVEPVYLNEGNIFHALLARLETVEDVERVLAEADTEGLFPDAETGEKMRTLMRRCLADEQARTWFDTHWRVINEHSIVERDAAGNISVHRPDRVITDGQCTLVIDYKTGVPRPTHTEQVRTYMDLLTRMGYPGVEGYLWYVQQPDNNIVSVGP